MWNDLYVFLKNVPLTRKSQLKQLSAVETKRTPTRL